MEGFPKDLSAMEVSNVVGIFFDIDDTFSTDGKITAEAYGAIWDLKKAGKYVVPITGRPAGWCDHIARMWPVDAVIGENGAFYFMLKNGKLTRTYAADPYARKTIKDKIKQAADDVLANVPGCALASEQEYREFDLAIDYCEDVPHLPSTSVDKIISILKKHGMTTKLSSIHVNAWFGDYNKMTTSKIFAKNEIGIDLDKDKDNAKIVFVGDSPNDEPMFAYFQKSVGVQNVSAFFERLTNKPNFITKSRSGAGFAEVARHVIGNGQ